MQITDEKAIKTAEERFSALLRRQLERVERRKEEGSPSTTQNWTSLSWASAEGTA
jgi:hypothetical protein